MEGIDGQADGPVQEPPRGPPSRTDGRASLEWTVVEWQLVLDQVVVEVALEILGVFGGETWMKNFGDLSHPSGVRLHQLLPAEWPSP